MSFEAYLKSWLSNSSSINEATTSKDSNFEDLRNLIDSGIGGDTSNQIAKTTSFETIEKVLEGLDPLALQRIKNNPELQKISLSLVSPGKVQWLGEYLNKSKKALNNIQADKRKIDPSLEFNKFTRLTIRQAEINSRIYKMYLIFKYAEETPDLDNDTNSLLYIKQEGIPLVLSSEPNSPKYKIGKIGRIDNLIESNEFEVISESGETRKVPKEELKKIFDLNPGVEERAKANSSSSLKKKVARIVNRLEETIKKDVADSLKEDAETLESLPNTEDTMQKLQVDWKPLIDALGYSNFFGNKIKAKEDKITANERPSLRKKNRIREKLMSALSLGLLPPVIEGEIIEPGGDYFKLMKQLELNNPAWLDASIKEVLISQERISNFNIGPRQTESILEEDQLAYLHISSNWIIKYVQSEVNGELSKRDMDNSVAKIKAIVQKKEAEIKNYYLSKDFNMKNFNGIQLKPRLKLPLYQKVRLAVSESDRIAESPLKNLIKGLGQIVTGLISGVHLDWDPVVAKRNADQNQAVFNGIFSIIKGGVFAVSKQGGRNFEKGVTKFTTKTGLGSVGLKPYDKKEEPADTKKVEEQMEPGVALQTPATLPDANMDTLSLAGPGKKHKKSKKKSIIPKISSFKAFLKM
jgi:hypothetical protein